MKIKINTKSLRFKIVIPIIILITIIMISLLIVGYQVSKNVFIRYHTFIISKHALNIKGIVDTSIDQLLALQLLNEQVVVDAKKKAVIDEIKSYMSDNNLIGIIRTANGDILYKSIDDELLSFVKSNILHDGEFHLTRRLLHIGGSSINIPLWQWDITFIEKPFLPFIYMLSMDTTILILVPFTALCFILLLTSTIFLTKKNLKEPIEEIISDIRKGGKIRETGISEFDLVGSTINESFDKLSKKTSQYETLHNISIGLYEKSSIEEILELIVEKVNEVIKAEIAAIIIYDEKGDIESIISKGLHETNNSLLEGKDILEFVKLSLTPIHIENVSENSAFRLSFPIWHSKMKNLLSYPIFDTENRPVGSLLFCNKPAGFTDDDEMLLKVIAADAFIALNKVENIKKLKRFQQVMDSAFDVIMITDSEGYIKYVNPSFEIVTGYSIKDVIDKKTNILKSGYHDGAFYKNLWNTIKSGKVWKGELINRKKDGELYYASATIFPVPAEGDIMYASIQRDITEEKKLFEQLLRSQKMEALGTLAGGIAHDFNNILTAIIGYSEMLMSMIKEEDFFYRPISIINNAAHKGADLTKKILTISRKERLQTLPVDINEIINSSVELLQRSIPKNIDIVLNLKKDIPKIMADPSQMQQVIMNLALNSVDAMPKGGRLLIETDIKKKNTNGSKENAFSNNEFVKITFHDTGIGMDAETQRKVFEPFFTTKGPEKGTGLGLYIVYSIINNHNGYINLYSEPNKGTSFHIYLPIKRGENTGEEQEIVDITGSGTILIIDDEADIRDLSKDILEKLGYKVLTAKDGNEGLRIFREMKDNILVVILDMIMPKMGGAEVFKELKKIKPDVKIILCSGYSQNGLSDMNDLLKNGNSEFVQKPFTVYSIGRAVKKILS